MKKLLAFLLAMTMLLTLAACGKETPKDNGGDKGEDTTTSVTTTDTEGTTTTASLSDCPPLPSSTTTAAEDTTTEGSETEGTTSATTTEGEGQDTTTTTKKPTTGATKPTSSTKKPPVTGFIPDIPTTTTTQKPTKTTKPTEPDDGRPTIKILSIGHSFSRDAMDTYMAELFKAAGYNATFGYLYYPGCSLERQYHYVKDNSVSYEHYNKCVDGTWFRNGAAKATDALWDEDWDIVTFQPSPDYGKGTMTYDCKWGCNKQVNDYDHFNSLVNQVRNYLRDADNPYGPNTDVEFYYHLTWAFASDCKLWSFTYSDYDQMTMYKDFINATKKYVVPNTRIKGVIPCITSVQNARSSFMGDTFNEPGNYNPNADGYHLNDKGDLVAAMTWVAYFTKKDANSFKISTKYSDEEYAAIAEAVNNAIKTPWSVTQSSYKTQP